MDDVLRTRGSARVDLLEMIPGLSEEQKVAIRTGQPIPPSPAWLEAYERRRDELRRLNATLAASARPEIPSIVAIMVLADPARRGMALHAIEQFRAQTYLNKQLYIVNASGEPLVLGGSDGAVVEHLYNKFAVNRTVAALRNYALDQFWGGYFVLWDDDDLNDPRRLEVQAAHITSPGKAVLLHNQVHCDLTSGRTCVIAETPGAPATGLYPITKERFIAVDDRNDIITFWMKHWSFNTIVVPNNSFPDNCLSVAVWHGLNRTPRDRFMAGCSTGTLGVQEAKQLGVMLASCGFTVRIETEPGAPAVV